MIFKIAEKFRPVLQKLFSQRLLKTVKNKLVDRKENRMLKDGIPPFSPSRYPYGVNLIGPLKSQNGLGQSARLLAELLTRTGVPCAFSDFCAIQNIARNDTSFDERLTDELPYGINLMHLNPFELRMAYLEKGKTLPAYRYNIGFWLWEIEKLPDDWLPAINLVDEIWTPSEYISNCFRKVTDKPVFTQQYPVTAPVWEHCDRAYFQLPEDQFLYLVMFDSNSTMVRKNPMGAVQAYKKAFPTEQADAGLVIKINNTDTADVEKLKRELDGYRNVYFITKTMAKEEVNSLIKTVDVLVSLHRAEGFGLVMAEAMLNRTVCVATDYSSNTEFMTEGAACMVGYDLTEIREDADFYPKGSRWAQPHIEEAAGKMRRLYEDADFYKEIAKQGERYISERLNGASLADRMKKRLEEIYG